MSIFRDARARIERNLRAEISILQIGRIFGGERRRFSDPHIVVFLHSSFFNEPHDSKEERV
jgi:hypothetical protein